MEDDQNLHSTSDGYKPDCPCGEDFSATLTVWKGDHGLVSVDSVCLQAIVYAKLTDAPVNIEIGRGPLFCTYDYPLYKTERVLITKIADIISHLRENGYNLDYNLSPKQCSECYALSNMVSARMKPILEYIWWLDSKNYEKLSARCYLKTMPFPFRQFYGRYRKRLAQSLIDILFPLEEDIEVIKHNLYSLTADTLSALSVRLRDSEYFFGRLPSSLDAVVYAYLAPLVYVPFPSCEIRNLMNAWPKLVEYVKRINSQIFTSLSNDGKCKTQSYIKCLQHLWYRNNCGLECNENKHTYKWSRFIIGLCIAIISYRFALIIMKLYNKQIKLRVLSVLK